MCNPPRVLRCSNLFSTLLQDKRWIGRCSFWNTTSRGVYCPLRFLQTCVNFDVFFSCLFFCLQKERRDLRRLLGGPEGKRKKHVASSNFEDEWNVVKVKHWWIAPCMNSRRRQMWNDGMMWNVWNCKIWKKREEESESLNLRFLRGAGERPTFERSFSSEGQGLKSAAMPLAKENW